MKEELKLLSNKIVEQANDSEHTEESLWTDFKTAVIDSMDKHVPSKFVLSRNISPWMTQEIKSAPKRKKRAYKKTKDPEDEKTFHMHNLLRDLNKMTRKSRRCLLGELVPGGGGGRNSPFQCGNTPYYLKTKSI